MIETLSSHRKPIIEALRALDDEAGSLLTGVNSWGDDLRRRLLDFTERGKLIRGTLVAVGAQALGIRPGPATYAVAAAVELVQSFLLVHDDIMDEDPIRRGVPAVFEQYRRHGADHGFREPARFGESMGICAGDVAILLAVRATAGIDAPESIRVRLISFLSDEIAQVGVAQMADVANGHSPHAATEQEILSVYRYKTGRYTFSLPLMLGAILAEADGSVVDALSTWGELQGMIFQIRDDHLGIMGDTADIGKPAGSDISSNKQTLHRLFLMERIARTEWADVASYFGHSHLTQSQIARVREALAGTGTLAMLEERIQALRDEARSVLDAVQIPDAGRQMLARIDEYNAGRTT